MIENWGHALEFLWQDKKEEELFMLTPDYYLLFWTSVLLTPCIYDVCASMHLDTIATDWFILDVDPASQCLPASLPYLTQENKKSTSLHHNVALTEDPSSRNQEYFSNSGGIKMVLPTKIVPINLLRMAILPFKYWHQMAPHNLSLWFWYLSGSHYLPSSIF